MQLRIAPVDSILLVVVQMLQPTTIAEVEAEAKKLDAFNTLRSRDLTDHFERLVEQAYLVRVKPDRFVVSPKSYFLIDRSLDPHTRDKARLLHLNNSRYQK